jgi:antitoxin ParD1/3/4
MATTSLSLGPHWEKFLKREIASGRYASASEVVRAALRELEERSKRLKALQDHLAEGAGQARRGEFVEFSPDDVLKRAKGRASRADKG